MSEMIASPVTLLPLAAYSSSAGTFTGTPVVFTSTPWFANTLVNVTTAPSSSAVASGTLDVYLQHSPNYVLAGPNSSNGSAVWDDFLHYTQITTIIAGTKSMIATWNPEQAPSSSLNVHQPVTATLAAGQIIQGALGSAWRAQAVIGGTSPAVASSSAWVFSVIAQVYR